MKSLKNNIEFKGTKDGFIIVVNNNSNFEQVKAALVEKINSNLFFFKGSQFCDIYSTNLLDEEKNELMDFLKENYSVNFIEKEKKQSSKIKVKTIDNNNNTMEIPTKFIRNTIRSGTSIEYNGNIIVLGDVNPGAQLTATGNIIVMGILRGIAHAGSKGDETSFVSAIKLNPIQLRIATTIAISPDEGIVGTSSSPQIAFVHKGNIVIENYPTKL